MEKQIFIFILIFGFLLNYFHYSLAQGISPPEPPESFKEIAFKIGKAILSILKEVGNYLLKIIIKIWNFFKNIWEKYIFPFFKNIWEKILHKEIKERKEIVKEEFKKEKEEIKQEVPLIFKNFWQKFKDLVK